MTSKAIRTFALILAFINFASHCHADVGDSVRHYRLQRQRQPVQAMPYPAAGYRPGRQFVLSQEQQPQNDDESYMVNTAEIQPRRPDLTYGAPVQAPAQTTARLVQEQQTQQQFFVAPVPRSKSARLTASAPKSARLAINSEDIPEDAEDEIATDIEVDVKTESEPRGVVATPQATTVYYPAGAVSFVQPYPGAAYVQTVQAPVATIAQPMTAAAYVQPQYSNLQVQPVAAAPVPVPNPAAAYVQPVQYSNLQVQSVAAAPAAAYAQPSLDKLQVQPVAAAPVAGAHIAAAPTPAAAYVQPVQYSNFQVQPLAAAAPAPASTAAYIQPVQYSNLQVQPVAAAVPAPVPVSAPAAAYVQTALPKLQVQPVAAAKLEAQPVAAAAPFYAPPVAYTTTQNFFSSPTAAYTTSAQLQAW